MNSPGALGSSNMSNPYAMGPLYHSPTVQGYCGPTDNLSLAGHYTDMRNSSGWYGSPANDPRFASECKGTIYITLFLFDIYNFITSYNKLKCIMDFFKFSFIN